MQTIYHSVPKRVFSNKDYINIWIIKFKGVTHIFDCPKSNIPLLSRLNSKFYSQHIK